MDKKKKSNIFESDDESDNSSNNEHDDYDEEENYEHNEIDDIDKVNENGSEEEEIFINEISGMQLTAEEHACMLNGSMVLDPVTGMPIYEDVEDEIAYYRSIVNNHNNSSFSFGAETVTPKKIKKVKVNKSKNKTIDYFKDMSENEDIESCKEGQFQSKRMLAMKNKLGLKTSVHKKKEYQYKLNSKFARPIDRTFSKIISENILISNSNIHSLESYPSLI